MSIHDDHGFSDPTPWMHDVKPGDRLRVDPYWNATTGWWKDKLPEVVEVVEVLRRRSQSGYLFRVKAAGGWRISLDAAWFLGPEKP